ncbi:dUTP diphosphatase, partial [Helicobacter bilis]|uniref:dUTP diphosphatase n=1 Tax=Helicobacter bilis TaxID=37372 RepID=UPI00397B7016
MQTKHAITLQFKKLHEKAIIPQFATAESAGFDFHALESCVLKANSHALIRTGLCMQIDKGYEIQVRSRSGLALKHKIMVLNSPGTIDSDYRG